MIAKLVKGVIITSVLITIALLVGYGYLVYQEKNRNTIELKNTRDVMLFFYRDDCKDCQKIFRDVYFQKLRGRKVILINMNNYKNRRYAKEYRIYSVPTCIKNNQKYVGSNWKEIYDLIRE